MSYPRNLFEPTLFADGSRFDPDEANKLGNAIKENREGIHDSVYRLNENELNSFATVDQFPVSGESRMKVSNGIVLGWPKIKGLLKTYRHVALDSDVGYDYQEFKEHGGNILYRRVASRKGDPLWSANTIYAVGNVVQPTTRNGYYYTVQSISGEGRSGSSQPSNWNQTTISDNQVTWTRTSTYWSSWVSFPTVDNPVFSGILVITPKTQQLSAAGNTILADSTNKLIENTTGAPITLTAVPTIPDGVDGQEIHITNIGVQDITFQAHATLANSNLRMVNNTRVLGMRDSISFKFYSAIGDWLETRFTNIP